MISKNDYSPDYDLAEQTSSTAAKKAKREYQILGKKELLNDLEKLVNECSIVIGLTAAQCKILLSKYKWDNNVLLERYYEADSTDRFLYGAGIIIVENNKRSATKTKKDLCNICLENGELIGLPCAHLFCTRCWTEYVKQTVINDCRLYATCPAGGCTIIIDEDFASKILKKYSGNDNVLGNYSCIQLNSYVKEHPLLKWCPAPNCNFAIKAEFNEAHRIICNCGHIYCFYCIQPWHAPISCGLLKIWLKQCSDDSETYNWINANTKDCPKCKTAIEKNGGCNHMTCRAMACKYEFCWVCLGDWRAHDGNYSCNRFTTETEEKTKKADLAKSALKRYLHYFNRYNNHSISLNFENDLYGKMTTKTEQLQSAKFSYVETLFLRTAVDVLCDCRRTLMYSYAFAYYLKQDDINTNIFEDNQQDLEASTELLSEYLELDLNQEQDLSEMKRRVQDKTRYVEARRKKMIQHCAEGSEQGSWKYNKEDLYDCVMPNVC